MEPLRIVRQNWKRFLISAIAWTVIFLAIAFLDRYLRLSLLFRRISAEAWLGLAITIITTFLGAIAASQKERQEAGLAAQEANKQLILQNNRENVESIREIEDGLDSLIARLNILSQLEERLRRIEEAIAQLNIDFADLDQRQKQGDRLLYALDLIAKLVEDVGALKAIARLRGLDFTLPSESENPETTK